MDKNFRNLVQQARQHGMYYPTFLGAVQNHIDLETKRFTPGDVVFCMTNRKYFVFDNEKFIEWDGQPEELYVKDENEWTESDCISNNCSSNTQLCADTLKTMFDLQIKLQNHCFNAKLPVVDEHLFQYYMLGLFGEAGEVLAADKQWKPCNKGPRKEDEVREELTDCFLFLINACLSQGFTSEDIYQTFLKKNKKVWSRIDNDRANGKSTDLV